MINIISKFSIFKYRLSILLAGFLLLIYIPTYAYTENRVKNIVIFFSLDATLPGYQSFMEGFRSSIYEQTDEPYNLLIEYLDVGRFPDNDHAIKVVNLYNERFKQTKIDLVITVAPGTYELLKKLGLQALKTSPVINVELENLTGILEPAVRDPNTLVITMKLDVKKTLNTAFNLFPERKNVYVLSGISPTDGYFMSATRQAATSFVNTHTFRFISGLTIDSVLTIVQNIPSNSLIIIPTYLMDSRNMPISSALLISAINNQSRAPVFTLSDNFIHRGGIGGYVFSFYLLGNVTRKASLEILNGKPLNKILVEENFYQSMYDWKQLKRWNLEHSKLIPKNSIFYEKEVNFLTEYRWQILFILLFLILESFLITYLYRVNRRQKEIMRQKSENEFLRLKLIREERLMRMAELTASLSHELNQPLTASLYNAQAGKRFLGAGKLDEVQAGEIFDHIIEDNKRASGIISSIRSLMKLETRENEMVNLKALIQETVRLFNSETEQNQIQVIVILPPENIFVFGDRIQLQQVLMNFISNAVHVLQRMPTEKRKIEIRLYAKSDNAIVEVFDTGPGIDETLKDKIFKPFVTSEKSGFGIGLALSRTIIEKHDGEIFASNLPGGGSQFSFKIKLYNDKS